jgi:hypothetical protein
VIASGPNWELRLGRWQDELGDVEVDAIVSDPPYGGRTHASEPVRGYDGGSATWPTDGGTGGLAPSYATWTPSDVRDFVTAWTDRCRGWMVCQTSHDLIPAWEQAYADVGRYCFAPIPCVMRGMSVRLAGDGPSSWSVYAVVARPRSVEFSRWGTLDGAYHGPKSTTAGGGRGKPDWLMQALVRDYTRPGDLVCDPFAGWGSTLAAATALGRRAIGSEMDVDAFNEATRRLGRPQQTDMFAAGGF